MTDERAESAALILRQKNRAALLVVMAALYSLVVLQNAWLHEDAFITFRTIDNFLNGYGLTWNVGERVQTFTHPLWLFVMVLAQAVSGEVYYSSIFVGWFCSLAAVLVLVLRIAPTLWAACSGIVLLCLSKAFIDYSTSGLENPLSHLLLALFVVIFLRDEKSLRSLFLLSFLAALAICNRMDTALIYAPALAFYVWHLRGVRAFYALACGFLPFVLWELFSLVYYGFLFPNTAYAKLNTGIDSGALALQGMYYVFNSFKVDPLTLGAIVAGVAWPLYRRQWQQVSLGLGVVLYLLYIVKIGGGYMTGRFLALPFLGSVCLLVHNIRPNPAKVWLLYNIRLTPAKIWLLALCAVLLVGLSAPSPPPLSWIDFGEGEIAIEADHGIYDERANYFPATGLFRALSADKDHPYPQHEWVELGRQLQGAAEPEELVVTTYYNLGILPYYAGSKFHHIDILGVTDPLLARLPAYENEQWSPGHFERLLPEGYLETLLYGRNIIGDRKLGAFYDHLSLITRGDLFSGERWHAIWKMSTGQYQSLINYEAYRHPSAQDIRRSKQRLENRVQLRPNAFARHVALGNIYFTSRYFDLAAVDYAEALKQPERQSANEEELRHAYLRLALSLYAAGREEQAVRSLEAFASENMRAEDIKALLQNALQQTLDGVGL